MRDLNEIVAENLIELRKKSGLTQQQLAKQFNYSDKTVSKWELGHAIPSVEVLKDLADFYGVTVDYMLNENESVANIDKKKTRIPVNNRLLILLLTNTVLMLIATVIFVWTAIATTSRAQGVQPYWQAFIWGASACFLISAFVIRKWWRTNKTAWLILSSLFVWTFITGFFVSFLAENVWYIYFVGVPVELCLVIISRMK
ncbi:MAG: helix-turn-helix domain-containing protein [Bacilli bacterium]|nr:helix-turn-helix domain-containing protein [Bacilli bacterium]